MIYLCPKCDKGMSSEEVDNGQCLHCKARFDYVGKKPEKAFNPKLFIKTMIKEIAGVKYKRTNYHDSAVDMLKAVLVDVVLIRREDFTDFYLVRDCEITSFLFRVVRSCREIRVEFDTLLKGVEYIKNYNDTNLKKVRRGLKSILMTKDFEYTLDVCCSVHSRKKYKPSPTLSLDYIGVKVHLPEKLHKKIKR